MVFVLYWCDCPLAVLPCESLLVHCVLSGAVKTEGFVWTFFYALYKTCH